MLLLTLVLSVASSITTSVSSGSGRSARRLVTPSLRRRSVLRKPAAFCVNAILPRIDYETNFTPSGKRTALLKYSRCT